ncbi:DUF6509 domain-containing protein [Cohnella lubricantis]|uniref:Pullulanase n=1 Tax=Cohnella lubricantis TaxID=2163172 RepID=A0A841TDD5_9BACL|nr:DUF6509 family protein [Cohnella lubricantis]MBB6678009.1 pullulanase [Cohnella lubricantis]MBP2118158.1 hypothetical protein [Cohnella lubricantis]
MLNIREYTAELVKDPFGILAGKRYEFVLDLDIEEDDELYSANGVAIRVIFKVDGEQAGIVRYDLIERGTGKPLDLDLEPEEEEALAAFCKEHLPEDE